MSQNSHLTRSFPWSSAFIVVSCVVGGLLAALNSASSISEALELFCLRDYKALRERAYILSPAECSLSSGEPTLGLSWPLAVTRPEQSTTVQRIWKRTVGKVQHILLLHSPSHHCALQSLMCTWIHSQTHMHTHIYTLPKQSTELDTFYHSKSCDWFL